MKLDPNSLHLAQVLFEAFGYHLLKLIPNSKYRAKSSAFPHFLWKCTRYIPFLVKIRGILSKLFYKFICLSYRITFFTLNPNEFSESLQHFPIFFQLFEAMVRLDYNIWFLGNLSTRFLGSHPSLLPFYSAHLKQACRFKPLKTFHPQSQKVEWGFETWEFLPRLLQFFSAQEFSGQHWNYTGKGSPSLPFACLLSWIGLFRFWLLHLLCCLINCRQLRPK